MPEYSAEIIEKLTALQSLKPKERAMAEVVAVFWPDGLIVYASADYNILPNREGLAPALLAEPELLYAGDLVVTLKPSNRVPLLSLPSTASVGDDKIDLTFSDLDGEFSTLLNRHGEGIRVRVFNYWQATPEVGTPFDLLLGVWRGHLHAAKEFNRPEVKVTASVGYRSAQLQIPRQPNSLFCPYIYGAHLSSQAEIDYHQGCPSNAHLTEEERDGAPLIGNPAFTDCPRRTREQCFERLGTLDYWPGVEIRPDPIPNNQTTGPNLLAHAIGNQSALGQPIRVIAGYRHVKALLLLAFRPEYNNNTPDEAFAAALFEVGKGPMQALAGFRINDQLVGAEHQQQRLGLLGQSPTDWSPDVGAFSGTAVIWGRIQTNVSEMRAADVSGSVHAAGLDNLRIYTDADTYTQAYTVNRMWWLLEIYCNPQWGYGVDYSRVLIESVIDTAAWCDEVVAMEDPNGNVFGGTRSTFNAELNARATQQQIQDVCTAGRIGLPFEWNGKDVFVPLRTESLANVPEFTDEGEDRNIVYDGSKSSLSWSHLSDAEMVNEWRVNFDDAADGQFIDTPLTFGDQLQQLRAGRAWGDRTRRVIPKSQAAFGITNFEEAARFGNTLLYLGPLDSGGIANPFKVKFTTWYSHTFAVQPIKLVRVLNAKLQAQMHEYFTARNFPWYAGIPYTYFRVQKFERKGDLKVEIEAQLYPEDYYATLDAPAEALPCVVGVVGYAGPFAGDSVTTHAATAEGNLLVARLSYEDETEGFVSPPSPAGWTLWNTAFAELSGGGVLRHHIWHRFAPAGGAQAFDLGLAPNPAHSNIRSDVLTADETHATLYFWDERAAQIDESASDTLTPAAPADADADGFAAVVFTATAGTSRTAATPAGYAELGDSQGLAVFARTGIAAGPIAAPSVVLSENVTADLYLLVLKPCEGGGLPDPPPPPSVPGDPALELGQETVAGVLGPEVRIHGTVTFPSFHLPLRADVFVTPPGGIETLIFDNLAPMAGSATAQFTHTPTFGAGEYCFRVVVETASETPVTGGEVTECITVGTAAAVFDVDLSPVLDVDLSPVYDV